jgi:hypothetical protein
MCDSSCIKNHLPEISVCDHTRVMQTDTGTLVHAINQVKTTCIELFLHPNRGNEHARVSETGQGANSYSTYRRSTCAQDTPGSVDLLRLHPAGRRHHVHRFDVHVLFMLACWEIQFQSQNAKAEKRTRQDKKADTAP